MDAFRELLHLGGYGLYVWPAFAVAALVLVWMGVSTLRRLRGNERMLERLQEIRDEIAETERRAANDSAKIGGGAAEGEDTPAPGAGESGGEGEHR